MSKILSLICLALWAVGTIGGIGYAVYAREYVIAAAVAVVGVMAFPTARKCFKNLTD